MNRVEDLIETVIDRRGWVALAHDGVLEPQAVIALVLNQAAAAGSVAQGEVDDCGDAGA